MGTKVSGKSRRIYWFGVLVAGAGAWLVLHAMLLGAALLVGRNAGVGAQLAVAWRAAAGALLIALGFAGMTLTDSFADGAAVTFDSEDDEPESADRNQPTAVETRTSSDKSLSSEQYGPPRPLILIRCDNCGTLNERSEHRCIQCGKAV